MFASHTSPIVIWIHKTLLDIIVGSKKRYSLTFGSNIWYILPVSALQLFKRKSKKKENLKINPAFFWKLQ